MLLDSTQNKQKILAEALKIAHQSGFSQENLALACVNSQIDAKYLSIIFSGGVDDLLQFMQEQQMLEIQTIASANELFDGLKISEKISFLLEQYFSYQLNQPIIVKHILHGRPMRKTPAKVHFIQSHINEENDRVIFRKWSINCSDHSSTNSPRHH